MSIKNKKPGPPPTFTERWQAIASTGDITRARNEYRQLHPKVALVDAHRTVSEWMSRNGYKIQHRQ